MAIPPVTGTHLAIILQQSAAPTLSLKSFRYLGISDPIAKALEAVFERSDRDLLEDNIMPPAQVKHSMLGDNGFPKISGKRGDFLRQLQHLKDARKLSSVAKLVGTVKLHGMHADIVFDLRTQTSTQAAREMTAESIATVATLSLSSSTADTPSLPGITFQSRNRICSPTESQNEYPRKLAQHPRALARLKTLILERFATRNPGRAVNQSLPLIVAGEWIGPKVQRDVGVSELDHRFVILTIRINGIWQPDEDYKDIEVNRFHIWSIHRAPMYNLEFDTGDLSDNNPVILNIQRLADDVERECPYAAAFGKPGTRGEGIVWKLGTPEGRADAKYWIKTKGPIYGIENRMDPASIVAEAERMLMIDDAVAKWVTPRRIEQGFEYLIEFLHAKDEVPSKANLNMFVEWVVRDVLTEEENEIEDLKGR